MLREAPIQAHVSLAHKSFLKQFDCSPDTIFVSPYLWKHWVREISACTDTLTRAYGVNYIKIIEVELTKSWPTAYLWFSLTTITGQKTSGTPYHFWHQSTGNPKPPTITHYPTLSQEIAKLIE